MVFTSEGPSIMWLSRYMEESERIIFHSYNPIELKSIRICQNDKWVNYELFFKVLYYIDKAISQQQIPISQSSEEKLVNSEIFNAIWNSDDSAPQYVKDCFSLFKLRKESIDLVWCCSYGRDVR